jgi:hypothetical protein
VFAFGDIVFLFREETLGDFLFLLVHTYVVPIIELNNAKFMAEWKSETDENKFGKKNSL